MRILGIGGILVMLIGGITGRTVIGVLGIYTILSTFFDIFPNVGH